MKRSRKSKGVSWAHGVNLCQTRLFSSEDCPSKVGQNSQDHLQAKASGMLHPHAVEFNDCPPGFEVTHSGIQSKDLSRIPLIKWKCPPQFIMSSNWRVVAGEESKEVESQKLREIRVLEAVYPRASAIPPGASVSADVEDEPCDDSLTPLVPIIPIEEDECGDMESDLAAVGNFPSNIMPMMASNIQLAPAIQKSPTVETSASEKPTAKLPGASADVAAAAASTALAVLMKSNEQGSMIDTDLLIQILRNPTIIQNLTNSPLTNSDSGAVATATSDPISVAMSVNELVSLPMPESDTTQKKPPNGSLPQASNGGSSSTATTLPPQMGAIPASGVKPSLPAPDPNKVKISIPNSGNFSKIGMIPAKPNITPVTSVRKALPCKDINYYKNLVRQHGEQKGTKEQNHRANGNNGNHLHDLNMVHNMKGENLRPKNQKPCIYFNSPKGCRNGVNCPYKHDISLNWRTGNVFDNQSAKRMKPFDENTGTT